MDYKKILYSWQSAVIIASFFISMTLANTTDSKLWWLLFIVMTMMLLPDAIKTGRS